MKQIRSAVLESDQKITVKNLPPSELLPDECEVTIKAAGICSSDIARGYGGMAYFYPLVMGHELAGEITRLGADNNDEFQVGEKVCVFPLLPCFNCSLCKQKRYALCKDYDYYGSRRHGGFCERLNVRKWNLLKIPKGVSLEDGALTEPTAVVLHAIEKLEIDPHQPSRLCILGAGFLGLIAVQIVNRFYPGCSISLVDRNQFKLDICTDRVAETIWVGNDESWESFLSDKKEAFDYILELAGTPETFSAAVHIAAPCGRGVWTGNISGDLTFPKAQVSSILRKELTFVGTWNSNYKRDGICDWTKALELFSKGLKPSEFVSLRIGLDEIDATLAKFHAHKMRETRFDIIKVLVNPNG